MDNTNATESNAPENVESVTLTKAELESLLAAATAAGARIPAGHRQWATKPMSATPKMAQFSRWIEREFADLFPDGVDDRLVRIASKAYGAFQKSDLNVD